MAAFSKEFGRAPTAETFAMALAAYQRSLISNNTPFDRFARGETLALSESARRGYEVFVNKANCITCHAGADFTDEEFRRIGIGWNGKAYLDPGRSKITGKEQDTGNFRVPRSNQGTANELISSIPTQYPISRVALRGPTSLESVVF